MNKGIKINDVKGALFGLAVGDALGVPVEFYSRNARKHDPIIDMRGYGTYNLPPGTWSDDSSLSFCLAEALSCGFDLAIIASNFQKWLYKGFWTPGGIVFDVGRTTRLSINRLSNVKEPELAGCNGEDSNGNGSLMRILPLVFYLQDKLIEVRFEITKKVSSITHGHIRSVISCFYYLEFARQLIQTKDKFIVYQNLQALVLNFLESISIDSGEINSLNRILEYNIHDLNESEIRSSGYVIDTLEASIWCLLTTNNYIDAVLKAVNLGEDTDTTAAVTGGLAGLLYGVEGIPKNWIAQIARNKDIDNLAVKFTNRLNN